MLDKEIYSYTNTLSNLISLLNAKQRGIDTDQGTNWVYKDLAGTLHVTANQKYWNGSAWIYENAQFKNLTAESLTLSGSLSVASMTIPTMGYRISNSNIEQSIEALDDSQTEEYNTGFQAWTGSGSYYTAGTTTFTVLRGGSGYIKGKKISWNGNQQVTGLSANLTYYIYINSSGTIDKTSTPTESLYTDNIVLFQTLYDGNTRFAVRENHPYTFNTRTSYYLHNNVGAVIRGSGAILTRIGTGTGGSATDRQIKIVGADTYEDHGLETTIPDSGGAAVGFSYFYTNVSGKWYRDGSGTDIPMRYNNAGVASNIPTTGSNYSVHTVYVTKDDLNTSTPWYILVYNTATYATQVLAEDAISSGSVPKATNELAYLELAQLGYLIVRNNASGGYVVSVIISKSSFKGSLVGSGSSNLASLILTNVTNFGGLLSGSDSNVQSALETLDDKLLNYTTTLRPLNTVMGTNVRWHFTDVLTHYSNSGSNGAHTGTIKITMPVSWISKFLTIRIVGYNYSSIGAWEALLGGYPYLSNTRWYNTSFSANGQTPFTSVRFGHDGTKCCILLGTTSTNWNFSQFTIADVFESSSGSSPNALETGWSASLITDETGITVTGTNNYPDITSHTHDSRYYTETELTNRTVELELLNLDVQELQQYSGRTSFLTDSSNTFIYRSNIDTGSFPFSGYGNLVLQSRSSADRSIVFVNGATPKVCAFIDTAGLVVPNLNGARTSYHDGYANIAIGQYLGLASLDDDESYLLHNATYYSSAWKYRETNSVGASYCRLGGAIQFATAIGGTQAGTITWNQGLYINTLGQVQIGYTSNSDVVNKLTVNGTSRFDGTVYATDYGLQDYVSQSPRNSIFYNGNAASGPVSLSFGTQTDNINLFNGYNNTTLYINAESESTAYTRPSSIFFCNGATNSYAALTMGNLTSEGTITLKGATYLSSVTGRVYSGSEDVLSYLYLARMNTGDKYGYISTDYLANYRECGIKLEVTNGSARKQAVTIKPSGLEIDIGRASVSDWSWISSWSVINLGERSSLANDQSGSGYLRLLYNAKYDTAYKYKFTEGASGLWLGPDFMEFNFASSGTAGDAITFKSIARASTSGFSVGNYSNQAVSPLAPLHVKASGGSYGSIYIDSTDYAQVRLNAASNTEAGIRLQKAGTAYWEMYLSSGSDNFFGIYSNQATKTPFSYYLSSIDSKPELRICRDSYTDPHSGTAYAIKVGQSGIAVKGSSKFVDSVTIGDSLTVTNDITCEDVISGDDYWFQDFQVVTLTSCSTITPSKGLIKITPDGGT